MSVIVEGVEEASNEIDFTQLLDLPEPTFADPSDTIGTFTSADEAALQTLNDDLTAVGLERLTDPTLGLEEPDYSRFENFIPHLVVPEKACDYCRSNRLACYQYGGDPGCTACNALFRECSFVGTTLEATNHADNPLGRLLDTLHTVDEDLCRERGTLTGVKSLASKNRHSGTSTPVFTDDAPGSSKRNGIRFPKHAVKVLREWLEAHASNPYPTEKEKADLEQKTELKPSQIANWLANARRRRKATGRPSHPKIGLSPSLQPSTPAINIPELDKPWDELDPLERWKNSPPEHEPARMLDIAHAVAHSDIPESDVSRSPSSGRRKRSSNGSGFSELREPSTTSFDTSAQTSSHSTSSAAFSHGSSQSHGSFGSFSSGLAGKRDRRRRRRPAAALSQRPTDDKKRIFQCTFCTDTFKSKYDWCRHEKSLHLSLEKWICAPLGPTISDPVTGRQKCVYCEALDPSSAHIGGHNHKPCEDKGMEARTFFRKDHVRQHLRLMHGCDMLSDHDKWKFTAVHINSRCGFCAKRFNVWQERIDHLTAHFKAGSRMSDWKGCRGLDPAVAAQVTNAMPPYLIGIESVSPNPFSASNESSHYWRHPTMNVGSAERATVYKGQNPTPSRPGLADYGQHTTCWEVLTVRLGKYANDMAHKGAVITDEMLQVQARRILYESDDSWNQTAADNPEWLDLFKKAHGLDFIPQAIGGAGLAIPDDPEMYGDLGLRIPFAVKLRAYNSLQAKTSMMADTSERPQKQALAKACRSVYAQLTQKGVLHDGDYECHGECQQNIIDVSHLDNIEAEGPRFRKWCKYQLPSQPISNIASSVSHSDVVNGTKLLGDMSDTCNQTGKGAPDERTQAGFDQDARLMLTEGCHLSEGLQSLEALRQQPINSRSESPRLAVTLAQDTSLQQTTSDDIHTSRARAAALMTLSRIEASQWDDCDDPQDPDNLTYLPYHKHALPEDRALLFATTTGPWPDSGGMPSSSVAPLSASYDPPGIEWQDRTTTGAMVEFLGGGLSQGLPFLNDTATGIIPLMQGGEEVLSSNGVRGAGVDSSAMETLTMEDLDNFIAATAADPEDGALAFAGDIGTADACQQPGVAAEFPASTMGGQSGMRSEVTTTGDLEMGDMAGVDDMDFDAIFDMHIDEDYTGVGM